MNTTIINKLNTTNNLSNPFETTVPALGSVSDKYKFISTAQFIADVTSLGYKLEYTRQPRRGLGMHYMSFSHPDMPKIEGLDLRLGFSNSHDGTHAFRGHVETGVGVCANVLLAWLPDLAYAARIVHRGYALDKVQLAIDAVRGRIDSVITTVQELQAKDVTPELGAEFLKQAAELRDAKPYSIVDLQRVQHREQTENNAWNVFNRVQESVIRGGYRTVELAQYDMPRQGIAKGMPIPGRRAKELTSVRERVQTNYKLWELAVKTLLNKA